MRGGSHQYIGSETPSGSIISVFLNLTSFITMGKGL
jgi:hypothetical protein